MSIHDQLDPQHNLPTVIASLGPGLLAALAGSLLLTLYYITMASSQKKPKAILPVVDVNNQSVVIDEKTAHRASGLSQAPDYYGMVRLYPECLSVFDVLETGKKASNNGPCLGSRTGPNKEYEWLTYQDVIDRAQQFGSALIANGESPQNDNRVGIYASNRLEWTIADFGCQAYSMCPVALYDTLGAESIKYILNQCDIRVLLCDTMERLKLITDIHTETPSLKLVVMAEQWDPEVQLAQGLRIISFGDFMEQGRQNLKEVQPGKPEDLFSICYTSGTTGKPKGVMLTHESFLRMAESILYHIRPHITFGPEDVHLSYLPLAHNFDRGVTVMMMMSGSKIGYYSRDITLLMDDLSTLKPTIFPSVPRLLNRIHDAVHNEVKTSAVKSWLLRKALSSKGKQVAQGLYRRDTFWDKIIFKKLQAKLGGRVRLVISGSAPLSVDVIQFLRCALGCVLLEGYGQTECGAGITFSLPGDNSAGNVGPPLPGYHVKLVDVPEMGFFVKDNVGEVCTKNQCMFNGYFQQPDKTSEAIDEDGWLHTGDIGTWSPDGCLKIIDRKKHLFKLSQGEYITPEKIEVAYCISPFVAQCFVDGNSHKPCVMAIVVPDVQYLAKWCPNNNLPTAMEEFCQSKKAKEIVLKDIVKEGKKAGLKGLEQVKDIILEPDMFSIQNGLLTPSMKSMRPALRMKYKDQINGLYASNNL